MLWQSGFCNASVQASIMPDQHWHRRGLSSSNAVPRSHSRRKVQVLCTPNLRRMMRGLERSATAQYMLFWILGEGNMLSTMHLPSARYTFP